MGGAVGVAAVSVSVSPVPDSYTLPQVAVLLLNWNGWPDLLECLESVLRLDYPNIHVIVCDNGSTDASIERVLDWAAGRLDVVPQRCEMVRYLRPAVAKPVRIRILRRGEVECSGAEFTEQRSVTLIANGANLGFAAGNNVGLRYALARGFEFAWLLNSDTIASPSALRALVARATSDPRIGMCGSLICYYDAPDTIEEAGGCAHYSFIGVARRLMKDQSADQPIDADRIERRLGYVSGASCLVRSTFLRDVGLMMEDYFLYGEELDWALRAKGKYRIGMAPDSIIYHKKGRTTGSKTYNVGRSATSAYYLWRARFRIARHYRPNGLPVLAMLGLTTIVWEFARGEKRSAQAIWSGMTNKEFI